MGIMSRKSGAERQSVIAGLDYGPRAPNNPPKKQQVAIIKTCAVVYFLNVHLYPVGQDLPSNHRHTVQTRSVPRSIGEWPKDDAYDARLPGCQVY